MRIEFLGPKSSGREAVQNHIRGVYQDIHGAEIRQFAPLLVAAKRGDGQIMCAAGIRTSRDGFFSDCYLEANFETVLREKSQINVPQSDIMEVVSLASTTPFPVLPILDAMIRWSRENGKTCGVFTATRSLRHLLKRSGMSYVELAAADASKVAHPESWGSYYDTDPWVCAFDDGSRTSMTLSPRLRAAELRSEAS